MRDEDAHACPHGDRLGGWHVLAVLFACVEAVLVAIGGVVASFGAAWLLIRRVPGVSRIL